MCEPPLPEADRITIVGSTGTTFGLAALADGANASATIDMRDSVISGVAVPVGRQAQNGGTARVTSDRSAYPPAVTVPDSGPGAIVETNRIKASMVSAAPSVGALIRAAQTARQDICSVKGRESECRSREIGVFSAGVRDPGSDSTIRCSVRRARV